MHTLTQHVLDTAHAEGASYADVRIVRLRTEGLSTKNGAVGSYRRGESLGAGVRVIVNGAWGFASAPGVGPDTLSALARKACAIARASASVKAADVALAPEPPAVDFWQSPRTIDPFTVPLADKLALLLEVDEILRRDERVRVAEGTMAFEHEHQWFASSEGARIEQDFLRSGGGFAARSVGHGDAQVRSYPASFGGNYKQLGYEMVLGLRMKDHAERVREEAVALLTADILPPGRRTLILHPSQMMLQIHESTGHPTELDRVLGWEANYAGTSFITPDKRGFRYGSPLVNLVCDGTVPTGLATAGYDDDGVRQGRWYLVREGLFETWQTSRETAGFIGESRSRGCNRAEGFVNIPIVRINNLSLLPGTTPLAELFASTEDGVYMDVNRSWSIDQRRLNFQFGCEIAWEIKDGQKGKMYKNPTYQGITPEFWGNCDAIADHHDWDLWGVINCGKGQPGQRAEMSHGSSHARFRDVMVGVR